MKRITAKIDEYEKDGQTKGRYVDIGVINSNGNGEYILLDPTVNLAGVLMKQRVLAQKQGKKGSNAVMCSIFENDNQPKQQQGGAASDFESDIPFLQHERFTVA